MPFISYTKALHFEWQAERGARVRARERAVTNRSRVSFLTPHPPLKKRRVKRVNKIEAMYESAGVRAKVKRYACC